jgi:glycerol-1-phosphate dehydrogenase [NAD(P)+]
MKGKFHVVDQDQCRRLCTCGRPHPAVDVQVYTGHDALAVLAEDCRRALGTGSVLLLDDANTHAAAGARLETLLAERAIRHRVLTLPGSVHATDASAEDVCGACGDHDLVVAVGSGTVNDLAKHAAGTRKLPYWTVPTAPSMNGYTSAIAAIKAAGVKRTLPCPPPQVIYMDPVIICRAPLNLRQAGFGDVLAKSVSDIDWQVESLLFSGSYCGLPSAIVSASEAAYRDRPEKIHRGDPTAVMALQSGLLVSGAAMSLSGSSAPASGGEHLVSHFLDMREDLTGRTPQLHGLQVAAGIILSAACYRKLAVLEPADVGRDGDSIFNAAAATIPVVWQGLAPEVNKRYRLKEPQLLALGERWHRKWEAVRRLCAQADEPLAYARLMRRTGFALSLTSLNVDAEEFRLAALSGRTIRERITVLDLAAQAGVLEAAAEQTIKILGQ